ncbi:MAG: HigA family addiction module antitoxin [Chloroflexota bacterium]
MEQGKIKVGMTPPHPGEFVREEILNELDLSVSRAAEILDVRRATLSDFVNEKSSLSPEMAMRIELAFSVKADTLLRMQAWYDSVLIQKRAGEFNIQPYEPVS